MGKKILIVGNSAKEYSLAMMLKKEGHEVHVAPGNTGIKEFAVCADIRMDSVSELVDYVMENDIDLTIPVSNVALKSGLVPLFKKNNLHIFAPDRSICDLLFDKAVLKKLLYRLKVPTPKFGIFEKYSMALEYIKNVQIPFVIKTNNSSSAVVLTSQKVAKNIINSCFEEQLQKIIIEDYIAGTPFCLYTITDGYKAIPIGTSRQYRYALSGDGGQLTSGMGACSPEYKLTLENEQYIINDIIYPLLEHFQSVNTPYLGILGIEAILTKDNHLSVIGIIPFMQDCDCQAILNNLDVNLYSIFESCVIGAFSDDIDEISLKNINSTSVTLNCVNKNNTGNVITGVELLNDETCISYYSNIIKNKYMEIEPQYGSNILLTCSGCTSSFATSKVYDELNNIKFAGKYFRPDIGK